MSALQFRIVDFRLRIFHSAIRIQKSAIQYNMAERVGFEPTLGFPKHAFQACAFSRSATSPFLLQYQIHRTKRFLLCTLNYIFMAERPGFEPGVELPPQQFSRLPPSTTRPPLRFTTVQSTESSQYRVCIVKSYLPTFTLYPVLCTLN